MRSSRRILAASLLTVFLGFLQTPSFSAGGPAEYVVTIQSVHLKDGSGRWVKIIEPDRRVDLAVEEAAVSFFNNTGRVPSGVYMNFRIVLLREGGEVVEIAGREDFAEPLRVQKGSFIHVRFDVGFSDEEKDGPLFPARLDRVSVTVDQTQKTLPASAVTVRYSAPFTSGS